MSSPSTQSEPPSAPSILITGASRGIGRAIAERFAEDKANLLLGYAADDAAMEETAERCRDRGAQVVTVRRDLAEPLAGKALVEAALESHGRLDVVVNNAAVVVEELVGALSDEQLEAMIGVNVLGLTRVARAAIRPMLRQRGGSIVNVSSIAARHPRRGAVVYAASKAYVETFTKALALELGPKNIRVNAVAPGIIRTAMSQELLAKEGEALERRVGLRRLGEAAEVANAVHYLCSPAASYVNGAVLEVDGGFPVAE
jgi:3-oxoacyl-[acyl-carrier protein] reductase